MVPEGWEVKNLGDIATISSGGTPSRSQSEYWDGDIPWVTTAEVDFRTITDTAQKITQLGMQCSSAKLFPKNTILMAMYGQGKTRGQVAKLGIEATTNQACAAIIPKSDHSHEFLFQYLQAEYENIRSMSNGGGQNNLSAGLIKEIPVPVPPLAEQTKIAQILSTWDKAIATTERLLANSQQQKQALMQQLLTGKKRFPGFTDKWEETTLGKVCTPQQWPTISSSQLTDSGYSVFGANGFIGYFNKFNHEHETVAVTCRGSTCGEVSLIPEKSYITGNSMCLDDINPNKHDYTFIYFLLCLRGFRDVISGSAQPQIVGNAIKTIQLSIPPLPEQQKIAQVLSTADAEISNLQAQLAKLKLEKKALMQQLLTGQRRVKLDADAAA